MFDPVMYDLNKYLAREDQAENFQEAVELTQIDLCKEGCEFYPYTGDAIAEALGEASQQQLAIIGKLIADPAKANDLQTYLQTVASSYWYAQAEETAIDIVQRQMEDR